MPTIANLAHVNIALVDGHIVPFGIWRISLKQKYAFVRGDFLKSRQPKLASTNYRRGVVLLEAYFDILNNLCVDHPNGRADRTALR